jgi:hypothetical protein
MKPINYKNYKNEELTSGEFTEQIMREIENLTKSPKNEWMSRA